MKKLAGFLLLSAILGRAQTAPSSSGVAGANQSSGLVTSYRALAKTSPSVSELYCAGFLSPQAVKEDVHVVGGAHSPEVTRFENNDVIYLDGGDLKEGDRYSILRHSRDTNEYQAFPGQHALLKRTGDLYAEIGRVKVRYMRGRVAVADVDFICSDIINGDIAVPFVEKESPPFRPGAFDVYAPANGKPTGRIVLAKEFDTVLGFGQVAYVNIGSNAGLKVGDYLRTTRDYTQVNRDPIDSLSYKANISEDTQRTKLKFDMRTHAGDLPRRSLGEMIVIGVTPTTATGLITLSLEDVHVGDGVELEEERPIPATTSAAMPPTISCSANPATIHVGESSTITCDAATANVGHTVGITFDPRVGLSVRDNTATLNTTGMAPGPVNVTATATDDLGLSANGSATVTVEAAPEAPAEAAPVTPPPAPVASKVNEFQFKAMGARVDNRAKAMLDDVALQLQREPTTTVLLIGSTAENEKPGLAAQRAANASLYLTKSKGIDPSRVQTKAGPTPGGNKVEIWIIPAGAQPPQ